VLNERILTLFLEATETVPGAQATETLNRFGFGPTTGRSRTELLGMLFEAVEKNQIAETDL